jgi:hypothetical protein
LITEAAATGCRQQETIMQNRQTRPSSPAPAGTDPDRDRDLLPDGPAAVTDPAGQGVLPLEELSETGEPAIAPTDPPVITALDDDEGGADAIDPDTGLPYEDRDPGTAAPPAGPLGGTPET